MEKPKHHVLVCASFRMKGEPKGVCHKASVELMQHMEQEILDRGLDILMTSTGCMKQCERGPVMVVYPEAWWFGKVESTDDIDEILDALEEGEACEKFLL